MNMVGRGVLSAMLLTILWYVEQIALQMELLSPGDKDVAHWLFIILTAIFIWFGGVDGDSDDSSA
jgi:hypothetical protein